MKDTLLSHLKSGQGLAETALKAYCYARTDLLVWCTISFIAGAVVAVLLAYGLSYLQHRRAGGGR